MRQQKVVLSSFALSMISAALLPYLLGRYMSIISILNKSTGSLLSMTFTSSHSSSSSLLSVSNDTADRILTTHSPSGTQWNDPALGLPFTEEMQHSTNDPSHVVSGTCQSLGIDMDRIDPQLLQSRERIEQIMHIILADKALGTSNLLPFRIPKCDPIVTSTISSASDTRSSRLYCHAMLPNLNIHVYTWPLFGTFSLDIFSCYEDEDHSIRSILPRIAQLIQDTKETKATPTHQHPKSESMVRWLYKLRGDRSDDGHSAYMSGDMDQFLHSYIDFDLKELVVSTESMYQTIDIYDTINPRFKTRHDYDRSLHRDGSYQSTHSELFRPDRILYLQGILQSRLYGDAAYHEALVHPALFTHPNPKRVAIIGGGEGATLREVLKHNTITTVTMIEIDELLVNVSKQFLPEWNDCSMIVGSAPSCFDDVRTEVFYTDAIAWFLERYLNANAIDTNLLYDIIIMDALYVPFLFQTILVLFHVWTHLLRCFVGYVLFYPTFWVLPQRPRVVDGIFEGFIQ
jgi:Spermine/spermidine synthase domain